VISNSAGFGCRFLKDSQAWRGLAGVEYLAIRSFDQCAELVGQGGDSGETLEKIEGYPFAFEKRSGAAGYVGYAIAFVQVVTVFVEDFQVVHSSPDFVDDAEEFGSGQDQAFSREEVSRGSPVLRYAGLGGDVSRSYVFLKGLADNVNNLRGH
jgi:hypothetical protein